MAQLIFDLAGHIEGVDPDATLLARSLGADSVVTTLWAQPRDVAAATSSTAHPDEAIFPTTSTTEPLRVTAHVWTPRAQEVSTLDACFATFPQVARFADTGEILVVGSRCTFTEGVAEQNAYLYAPDGSLVRRGVIGDGIEHIQIDDDGNVWVGYFDEGVFGNLGWGLRNVPIGAPGIVCFDRDFEVTWAMPESTDYAIADCYALTTDGSDVYACTYTDFPILRIREGSVTAFSGLGSSTDAILVRDGKVAVLGTNVQHARSAHVVNLNNGAREPLNLRIGDNPIAKLPGVANRGDTALLIQDRDVFLARLQAG